jgi:glucosamine kinase
VSAMRDVAAAASGVLGVDGGQSAIRLCHSDDGRVVEVEGVSRLEGDTVAQVAESIARGLRDGGLPPAALAVLGLTTAPSNAADADHLCALVAIVAGAREVVLVDDAVTWHAGALAGGWGVSLVGGTGVACLSLPEAGSAAIIGGHGYLLGDEGGSYWMGRHGIGAALRASEGRGPATSLVDAARERFGDLDSLHVRLHETARAVNAIAGFAPDVLDAAAAGDPVATGIVDDGASELAALAVAAVTHAAGLPGGARPHHDVPLALGGRLLGPGSLLRDRLLDRLAAAGLAGSLRGADGTPLDGAMRLADPATAARYGRLVHRWTAPAPSAPRSRPAPLNAGTAPGGPGASARVAAAAVDEAADHAGAATDRAATDRATTADDAPTAGRRYLASARGLLARLDAAEWPAIAAAAELVADALAADRTVRAFGTGHSHMLAEEIYYRAGGLVRAQPILVESLMLHEGGERSTELERIALLGNQVFHEHPMEAGDVLFIASNSGGNAVGTTLAGLAVDRDVRVIAIESRAHATSSERRQTGVARLHDIADIVIDNGGRPGDATVEIDGFPHRVGPTSTVTGAAILNAIVAEAVERLVARGITPEVYRSANVEGGDELNARYAPDGSLA